MSQHGDPEPNETTGPLDTPSQPAQPAQPEQPAQPAPTWEWAPLAARPTQAPSVDAGEPRTEPLSPVQQQPSYGPPPFGQPTFATGQYGQPSFAQAPHGQQPHGQQPPFGQQTYGGWGYPYGQPMPAPAQSRSGLSRRTKIVGGAAAVLLVGGAAAGGAAFGFSQAGSSSASGLVGGSGPSQVQPYVPPSTGNGNSNGGNGIGDGNGSQRKGDGHASRFSAPGKASEEQSVGVVDINTRLKYEGAKAAGTGMILTSNGQVLTNNHVIQGATKIKVTVVSTGQKYTATVVGTDKVDDVAVLQLAGATGLQTVQPDTATPSVGDAVTAVGNAMGAGGVPSAAEGTITALNQSITTQSEGGVQGERLTGLIQVDAMVVSGDSGGPLYDADNEVIGMDTAASSSPLESTGFAIPIGKALSIANLITSGQGGANITLGTPAFLGVSFSEGAFGQSGNGAVVTQVLRGTPAQRAGIIAGDTIVSVNGTGITSGEQLRTVLQQFKPGDSVSVTWLDTQGGSHTASVELIAGPAQ